ncbi:MAG TPA: Xaa-Pro peptidase family protein [Terriglobales bacterium]|nr:Xaa-Pro peptidase family protein [Terriglobales bacterium]
MTSSPHSPARAKYVRDFLQAHRLKAWLAWRPDELVMLSGYATFWGASFLLYFAEADPVLFVPVLEPRDNIPGGLIVHEYPWGDLKCSDPFAVLIDAIRVELNKAGVARAQTGMLRSASRSALPIQAAEQIPIPELFWEQLSAVIAKPNPNAETAFLDLYLKKTTEEVKAIRLANRVAGIGIKAFHESLTPEISEVEIAAAIETAIQKQIGQDEIFHARGWAMVQSGPNSADSGKFNRSTGRKLQSGDLVLLELATCVNGYWSDLTRTAPLGELKPQLTELFSIVSEAQQAALAKVRPGVAAGEVDAAARDIIAGLSQYFTHGTGHHVGFRYHDPGFGLVPGQKEKLAAGMIITIEPGAYVPQYGGGVRIEDNVLVTDSGYEILSRDSRTPLA